MSPAVTADRTKRLAAEWKRPYRPVGSRAEKFFRPTPETSLTRLFDASRAPSPRCYAGGAACATIRASKRPRRTARGLRPSEMDAENAYRYQQMKTCLRFEPHELVSRRSRHVREAGRAPLARTSTGFSGFSRFLNGSCIGMFELPPMDRPWSRCRCVCGLIQRSPLMRSFCS